MKDEEEEEKEDEKNISACPYQYLDIEIPFLVNLGLYTFQGKRRWNQIFLKLGTTPT